MNYTRAIILHTQVQNEADKLVTFFGEKTGKLIGLAKNAMRSVRRFGGGLEPGTLGRIWYVEGPRFLRIDEVAIERSTNKITKSLNKIAALNLGLELAMISIPMGEPHIERFELFTRWLAFIGKDEPEARHRYIYMYKWIALSGYRPILEACSVCGGHKKIEHIAQRGLVCANCLSRESGCVKISPKAAAWLNNIKGAKANPSGGLIDELDKIFNFLVMSAFGRELRTIVCR